MKSIIVKFGVLVFLFTLLLSCGGNSTVPAVTDPTDSISTNTTGKVLCSEQGIAGVVVTDGTNFTVTDESGSYSLPYNSSATHVYISSPAGYTVPVVNSVPQFYIKPGRASKSNVNFNLLKLDVSDQKHYFVAIGDPQVRNEAELNKLKPILDYLKTDIEAGHLNPVHLMIPGDVVFDTPNMHTLSKTYYTSVGQPVYYAIGNHDHIQNKTQPASDSYDKKASETYISHYGPTYYSFNRGQAHYIVLDNIFYRGGPDTEYSTKITQEQLDWVKKDLSYVSKDKILIIMGHSPSKSRALSVYGNYSSLFALCAGYKDVHIISGHTHYNSVMFDGSGITDHIIGAACGGWWEGPVCPDGTYMGYKIFEIDGTTVKWKYRAYLFPDKQFTVYKPGPRASDLRPAQELLVNVWDWDTRWSVSWSEDNGATFRSMTRISAKTYDPTAYEYYGYDGDASIPTGRGWIDAGPTDHIFSCIPASATKKVIVKVINPFNEVFTEDVDL